MGPVSTEHCFHWLAVQVFMLTNSQPFPASYEWVMAEGGDPSVWTITPASGQLGGPSSEEVTVRWTPKPNAPPGETEVCMCMCRVPVKASHYTLQGRAVLMGHISNRAVR